MCSRSLASVPCLAAALVLVPGCAEEGAIAFPWSDLHPWVSPLRCTNPCPQDASLADLASIDEHGHLSPAGAKKIHREAQPALEALLQAAQTEGLTLTAGSAFRTHAEQIELFENATQIGRAARPGHSEHELGLAVDFDWEGNEPAAWLAAQAWRFGFVMSYPGDKAKTTGFRSEPWHFRYLGSVVAARIHDAGLTPEEYFALHPEETSWGDCSDCPFDISLPLPCSEVTEQGICEGDVLTWCKEGARAAVDCSTWGRACAPTGAGSAVDCL